MAAGYYGYKEHEFWKSELDSNFGFVTYFGKSLKFLILSCFMSKIEMIANL